MRVLKTESICVFGSAARASTDKLSDRDVLIVAETSKRRNELAIPWRQRGWSTALYSPSRLKNMAKAKSLFIQHLKLEGIILEDQNGWLGDTLIAAEPKEAYLEDALASVSLALPMQRLEGKAKIRDCLIAADLAYTSVRNFGICFLADRKELCFDYSDIVDHLAEHFRLDQMETTLLQSLRAGKAAYRSMAECKHLEGSVEELRSLLTKFFLNRTLGDIAHDSPIRKLSGGYTMLRDFEASIVRKIGGYPSRDDLSAIGLETIWRLVRNPREYSWRIHGLESTILDEYNLTTTESSSKQAGQGVAKLQKHWRGLPLTPSHRPPSLLLDGGRV